MHHTVTAIHNGTAALVIGGRSSPACPNDTMFVLKISASGSAHWSKVVLHPDSSAMEPRWRHTANCISDNDGKVWFSFLVLVFETIVLSSVQKSVC